VSQSAYRTDRRAALLRATRFALAATLALSLIPLTALQGEAVAPKPPAPPIALAYATYLGGSASDMTLAADVATDASGATYVVSSTLSPNFPVVAPIQATKAAADDVVVSKISPDGSTIEWSTYLGGNGSDYGRDIAVDTDGNVIVVGMTFSTDFPLVAPFDATPGTATAADDFVTKIAADGSHLIYSSYLGGNLQDGKPNLTVDNQGNAWIAGYSHSRGNFPTVNPLPTAYHATEVSGADAFISKVSPTGTLLYSTLFGGTSTESARGIAVDQNGSAIITGFVAKNLPVVNAAQPVHGGDRDGFVAKLTPSGNGVVYSTYWGGSAEDGPYSGPSLGLDAAGNAFVAAYTESTNFPTKNAAQPTHGGGRLDAVVGEFSPTGNLIFSTYLGGEKDDAGQAITVDPAGTAWVTGYTRSTLFPRVSALGAPLSTGYDTFATRYAASGQLLLSSNIGAGGSEKGYGITAGADGTIHLIGSAAGTDLPVVSPVQATTGGGPNDLFIFRLAPVVDVTPPQIVMTAPASDTVARELTTQVTWTATDDHLVDHVDVYRRGGLTGTQTLASSTTSARYLTSGLAGETACFQLRAVDGGGNQAWSPERCVAFPLDDANPAITYSGATTVAVSADALDGAVTKMSSGSASFSCTCRYLGFLTQKGPSAGKAGIYVDDVLVSTVDLYAAIKKDRQYAFKAPVALGAHTLRIQWLGTKHPNSTGTQVAVDGIAAVV